MSSFDAIVDDEPEDRTQAIEWAAIELIRGRQFEVVAAELAGGGWSPEAAEAIVEAARQLSRAQRGVTTRDAIARGAEGRYRRTMANTRWFAFGGLPILFVSIRNMVIAARGILSMSRRRKD